MQYHRPSTSRRFGYNFIDFLDVDNTEIVGLSQEIRSSTEDTAEQDETDANVDFGAMHGTVVGLRYYTGVVNKGEMISLVREPRNPYDRNAVMVANVYGSQVGHISKQLAAPLARIMDDNLARVEGVVPYGVNNKFSMPVNLTFWGKEENKDAVLRTLKTHGFELGSESAGGSRIMHVGRDARGSYAPPKLAAIPLTAEQLKNVFDKLFDDLMENKTREMEPGEAVCTPLLPHQKQALAWMTFRENHNDLPPFWEQKSGLYFNVLTNFAVRERPDTVRGGILADDMGLGKTLTTIALIISNFHHGKPLPLEKKDVASSESSAINKKSNTKEKSGASEKQKTGSSHLKRSHEDRATVVSVESKEADPECMLSEAPKKKAKATKKSGKGSTSTQKGSGVLLDDSDFAAALESCSAEVPVTSQKKKKKQKKSAGAAAVPSASGDHSGARATLIMCPLSVLSNWLDQFEQHVHADVKLNVYLYYGPERNRDPSFLAEQDVVLTTYNVLSADHGNTASSPLHKVRWLRVVLDEGHVIRNPNAQQSKAVLSLSADRRWILSGTPIQNCLKDLWMLLSFLKLKPFDVKEWWNRVIQRPVTQGDPVGLQHLQALVKGITLRRTKSSKVGGRTVVDLPGRKVLVQHVTLTEEERERYEQAKAEGRNVIGRYVTEGSVMTNYADVLVILMRLRQLCCHPGLLGPQAGAAGDAGTPGELRERLISKITLVLSSGSDEECAICLDSLRQPVITYCAHVFCRPCICHVIRSEQEAKCPLCRAHIKTKELVEYPGEEEEAAGAQEKDEWRPSSKVDALMSSLLRLRSEDGSIKSLVVSQFTKFLNVLEVPLREQGFSFTRLDGTMSQRNRAKAIQDFQDASPESPSIMLLSLKAGGLGLNLTAASCVFLMDPAWNPAAEDQCIDRCHRLGQTRDVVVTKFIVKDSVEENMVFIQKKKQDLVAKAFGAKSSPQTRIEDIRTLMDL